MKKSAGMRRQTLFISEVNNKLGLNSINSNICKLSFYPLGCIRQSFITRSVCVCARLTNLSLIASSGTGRNLFRADEIYIQVHDAAAPMLF